MIKMNRTTLYMGTAGAVVLSSYLAGCSNLMPVTQGQFDGLAGRVSKLSDELSQLKPRVQQIETRPLAEVPIMLTKGRGYDLELGEIVGIAINKYENSNKRKIAEMVAAHPKGGVIVVPTVGGKVLNVYFVLDGDGDGKPTFFVDKYVTDITKGGQEIDAVKIEESSLVERTRELLIRIKSVSK